MNRVDEIKNDAQTFDFTAVKIFFSVIAILLSVTLPEAFAVTDKVDSFKLPILDHAIFDLKKENAESIWNPGSNRHQCAFENANTLTNQKSRLNFTAEFFCPLKNPTINPNAS